MSVIASLEGNPRLLDAAQVQRAVTRMAHEVAERHSNLDSVVIAGIRTRGVPLAQRVAAALAAFAQQPAVAAIDTAAYRDDRPRRTGSAAGAISGCEGGVPPNVDGATVIVADDVIFTGRTLRAALDALVDAGRPAAVEVLVLVDRGHRELPMRATYVGKNTPTAVDDRVSVRLREIDGFDGAWLLPAVKR